MKKNQRPTGLVVEMPEERPTGLVVDIPEQRPTIAPADPIVGREALKKVGKPVKPDLSEKPRILEQPENQEKLENNIRPCIRDPDNVIKIYLK